MRCVDGNKTCVMSSDVIFFCPSPVYCKYGGDKENIYIYISWHILKVELFYFIKYFFYLFNTLCVGIILWKNTRKFPLVDKYIRREIELASGYLLQQSEDLTWPKCSWLCGLDGMDERSQAREHISTLDSSVRCHSPYWEKTNILFLIFELVEKIKGGVFLMEKGPFICKPDIPTINNITK